MKIAIVHDWLNGMRGGEKVLEAFCEMYPEADIFTLFYQKGKISALINAHRIKSSILGKFPFSGRYYRWLLPFFPAAIRQFDLKGYDTVISNSHCVAKFFRKPKNSLHVCYCMTPMRYAWEFRQEYFGRHNRLSRFLISLCLDSLKKQDLKSNDSVDLFIAISDNIREKIARYYQRDALVVYPPVDVEKCRISGSLEDYFLVVASLVPYKRIDIAIEAFNRLKKRLIIVGIGPLENELKKMAGENITFLGWVADDKLPELYSKCQALIFPGEEDFGIAMVETLASGRPVIAYNKGGAAEIVKKDCGFLFNAQNPQALIEAVGLYENKKHALNSLAIREAALKYSKDKFKESFNKIIHGTL
ncbi:MAG: glycosyltransferase [Candidatus Omnitrophica bacterium]|nr:glycosyltransferase [Candidatus Omnitrophota bacterium]MDD5237108.1 glycosyltransferase [Candidatus Omnitrophota bacterium]MDD5610410.1 glycosyltransferase [Candidatus Omnitrophota bacterium]